MSIRYLGERAILATPATSTPTPPPDPGTPAFSTGGHRTITTYLGYLGTVSRGSLRLWLSDGERWYRGDSTPLTSTDGDRAIDWALGAGRLFAFQVETIEGGGTVTVLVEGV